MSLLPTLQQSCPKLKTKCHNLQLSPFNPKTHIHQDSISKHIVHTTLTEEKKQQYAEIQQPQQHLRTQKYWQISTTKCISIFRNQA